MQCFYTLYALYLSHILHKNSIFEENTDPRYVAIHNLFAYLAENVYLCRRVADSAIASTPRNRHKRKRRLLVAIWLLKRRKFHKHSEGGISGRLRSVYTSAARQWDLPLSCMACIYARGRYIPNLVQRFPTTAVASSIGIVAHVFLYPYRSPRARATT